jgi:Ala-tRNA(Pro) deacylase
MPAAKLKQFLDEQGVKYVTIGHSPAFTAQEIAASAHISGREMAKTVMVTLDGTMAMAVLPASRAVDFEALKAAAGASEVKLASEADFRDLFAECEVGAMPPFGNLYDMAVYADESLAEDDEIAFNAGTHKELVKLAWSDYQRLVEPTVAAFARPL